MKTLIFIDNDGRKMAEEDADMLKNLLESEGVSDGLINSMQVYADFNRMSREDAMKLLFSGKHIICTWSMYTSSHYNSLGQMLDLFRAAGRKDIKGLVYIDGSGRLFQALDSAFHYDKLNGTMSILNAIETNHVITFKDGHPFRIRVRLEGYRNESFKLEAADLKTLLSN